MSYHYVSIEAEHRIEGDKAFYTVTTAWSKWDMDRLDPSEAYTLASEGHEILRWSSNDSVIPGDIAKEGGWPYLAEMDAARDAQLSAFAAEYRAARARMTPEQREEELFEMRAAFGEGETVVNVITGERTKL